MIGEGNLVTMLTSFSEPINEGPLSAALDDEAKAVALGWGKKETQFHGSVGKAAAQEKAITSATLTDWDDRKLRLSWRGDAEYYACSFIEKGHRTFKVFDREGTVQATSELVDKMSHSLHWRPAGNVLTSTDVDGRGEHRVIFFERNGLRHGEFRLHHSALFTAAKSTIRDVCWNIDSTILAVTWDHSVEVEDEMEERTEVQLYTCSNYQYSLQYASVFAGSVVLQWDATEAGKAYLIGHEFVTMLDLSAQCHASPGGSATVGVVDGATVRMTAFAHMNVPPPMSAYRLKEQIDAPVRHVAFAAFPSLQNSEVVAVLTECGHFVLYALPSNRFGDAALLHHCKEDLAATSHPRQMVVYATPPTNGDDTLSFAAFILYHDLESGVDFVRHVIVAGEAKTEVIDLPLPSGCFGSGFVASSIPYGRPRLVCRNGDLKSLSVDANGALPLSRTTQTLQDGLPQHIVSFPLARASDDDDEEEEGLIYLTQRGSLYIGRHLISDACTSFTLHSDYLIFTTTQSTARLLRRDHACFQRAHYADQSDEGRALMLAIPTSVHPYDVTYRALEKGARAVVCVPDGENLVLQMPRGNLETVTPLGLVLSTLQRLLRRECYSDAFLLARRARLDLNLLFDVNAARLKTEAGLAVMMQQLLSFPLKMRIEYLNLLLTSLSNENVLHTKYISAAAEKAPEGADKDKLNSFCRRIRQYLLAVGDDPTASRTMYTQPILTTFVKERPPQLKEALLWIKAFQERGEEMEAEEALKYLIFLADVNTLYDVALGMYDFDLTLLVATQSQKVFFSLIKKK